MENSSHLNNKIIRKVTLVGAAFDLLLGVLKITVGWVANSHALVADGIHSLSDLGTDFMVILVARQKLAEPDDDHPYGHDRFQTLVAVILAMLLALVAIGIAWDAITRLLSEAEHTIPGTLALWIAGFSAIIKEGIYHYTASAARQIDSRLLLANAWHSRSDALSSLVVFIAVSGSIFGFVWADALGALIVSVLILHIAWEIGRAGAEELVDTGLDGPQLDAMRDQVLLVDGVEDMHDLRTRKMGSTVFADMHVHVAPTISVSEGHRIGDEVHYRLKKQFPKLSDILVHIDPQDDQQSHASANLPLRKQITSRVEAILVKNKVQIEALTRLQIHYLADKTELELCFELLPDGDQLSHIRQELEALDFIHRVIFQKRF
jgi:cation diffusion facilitator family transporter